MKNIWHKAIDMPPVWLLAFMIAVYFQKQVWNPLGFDAGFANFLGWVLILAGLAIFGWAFLQFRSHKTSVVPRNTPKAFIAAGPYKYSRNPIYLADAIVLLGFALIQGSATGILLVPVFTRIILIRFINGEEAGLKAAFPEEFAAFCSKTRRWI
jgi:protein-S-isoprenylcysteine O-methyltransferase Ste14